MKLLEERICREGLILPGNVLKVDMFLNHQIDVKLITEMGKEFYHIFSQESITKILTVEASGIPIACAAAAFFDVPVVFAKKGQRKNMGPDFYTAEVFSFTKGSEYTMHVSKNYLSAADRVLIIDDFLANGAALTGLTDILAQSGASLAGVGIAIEKVFQGGGEKFRSRGIPISSLAMIESMDNGEIVFCSNDCYRK